MNTLRSVLVFAWMVVSIIPVGLGLILCSLFLSSANLWRWFARPWLRGVVVAARWVGGVDYRLTGEENLPGKDDMRRVILVSKHQSTWETFFFPSMMPHNLAYVFKKELLRIPIFGWCMARLEMVPIDRSKRSEAWNKVAQYGVKLMDRGRWIIMFPEGTRSERGGQGNYKSGASRLAVATDALLIPIAVSSGQCWPRRSFSFIPGRIDVSIGTPIPASGGDPEALMRQVETWIEAEMRRIDPDAYVQTDSPEPGVDGA
ncbi:lysophospholipid acyltransferase family protein [Congregibacter variabilis]|uniref:Lysophospholipid acyltransferase family protein n=1 Tax=Congregibacter variabilis TaxID=3081200 RepID=A0ABZ0I481_9GAMM|nr:lysophospholipid acyltransferase family protein [Congregibacter sp. IMCC43200]